MSEKGSVFQKGGGGTNFEQSIQAAFIAGLVIRGSAPCLPANEIIEVSFQNTSRGYETDDLLVISKSVAGEHKLLMQIKHNISFTENDGTFKEVLQAFWKDYTNAAIFDQSGGAVNNFDLSFDFNRQARFNRALNKFGWKDLISTQIHPGASIGIDGYGWSAGSGHPYQIPRTRHIDYNHYNHLHLQGFRPKLKIINIKE